MSNHSHVIAINAVNSNSGGGRAVRDSILSNLTPQVPERVVLIAGQDADLSAFDGARDFDVHRVPVRWTRGSHAPYVYNRLLRQALAELDASVVINLGDLVIRTSVPQVFVFDWAYAVDVHPKVWAGMTWRDWMTRRIKLAFVQWDFCRPAVVVAQTDEIARVLRRRYGLQRVEVIGNAPSEASIAEALATTMPGLPDGIRLLVPSLYYPHKNFEVLLDVADHVRNASKPYRFVVTITPTTAAALAFLSAIERRGLQSIICNVGQVPYAEMGTLYDACHGVVLPTLLESFTFVYLEAMQHQRPLFTSDMWFARGVCGPAAVYFDPFDPLSIFMSIDSIFEDDVRRREVVRLGCERLSQFPSARQNTLRLLDIARSIVP